MGASARVGLSAAGWGSGDVKRGGEAREGASEMAAEGIENSAAVEVLFGVGEAAMGMGVETRVVSGVASAVEMEEWGSGEEGRRRGSRGASGEGGEGAAGSEGAAASVSSTNGTSSATPSLDSSSSGDSSFRGSSTVSTGPTVASASAGLSLPPSSAASALAATTTATSSFTAGSTLRTLSSEALRGTSTLFDRAESIDALPFLNDNLRLESAWSASCDADWTAAAPPGELARGEDGRASVLSREGRGLREEDEVLMRRGRGGVLGDEELLGLARLASNSLTDSPSLSPSDFSWENIPSQLRRGRVTTVTAESKQLNAFVPIPLPSSLVVRHSSQRGNDLQRMPPKTTPRNRGGGDLNGPASPSSPSSPTPTSRRASAVASPVPRGPLQPSAETSYHKRLRSILQEHKRCRKEWNELVLRGCMARARAAIELWTDIECVCFG